jgi:transposase
VGIDTHSAFIQVAVIWVADPKNGKCEVRRAEREFSTEWADLHAAKAWTLRVLSRIPHAHKVVSPDTLRYCIESTGTYHMPILLAWRGCPAVVNPLLAGPTRRKTDVLDARLLAHHSITGLWKPSFIPTQAGQELRVIWATRGEAQRRATRAANQINNIVLRFGHTFGRDCSMRSAMGEGIISDLLDGRIPSVPTVNPDGLPASVRPRIRDLLVDLSTNQQRVKRAIVEATNYIGSHEWPLGVGTMSGTKLLGILKSVPGVGDTTAITWLSEIADPRRFVNDKQVAAFSGCDPSLKVSAGKVTSLVRRMGNKRLHQSLLYAAAGLLRRPAEPLGQWGRSIAGRHKKGGHRKACGAVARRLACALWHVHRKGEMFTYDGYQLSTQLQLPNVRLSTFVPKRALILLRDEGVTTTKDLASAYSEGRLATIFGLGAATLAGIKDWIQKHIIRRKFGQRKGPLAIQIDRDAKGAFVFPKCSASMSDSTDAARLAQAALCSPSSPAKGHKLRPSLATTKPALHPKCACRADHKEPVKAPKQ